MAKELEKDDVVNFTVAFTDGTSQHFVITYGMALSLTEAFRDFGADKGSGRVWAQYGMAFDFSYVKNTCITQ